MKLDVFASDGDCLLPGLKVFVLPSRKCVWHRKAKGTSDIQSTGDRNGNQEDPSIPDDFSNLGIWSLGLFGSFGNYFSDTIRTPADVICFSWNETQTE